MSRYCERCGRAKKACLCDWLQQVDSTVEVIILQHPSEVNQAKGTAKIVELSVSPCHLFVGEDFSKHAQLNERLAQPNVLNLILFPSNKSKLLEIHSGHDIAHSKVRLIVIDGTWKKAFKIFQLSKNLHAFTQVHLPRALEGRYTIRKAPKDNALSTVEAVYHALSIMQACDATPLITAFDKMIEFQIAQLPEGLYEKHFAQRRR